MCICDTIDGPTLSNHHRKSFIIVFLQRNVAESESVCGKKNGVLYLWKRMMDEQKKSG